LALREEDLHHSMPSYKYNLQAITGTIVSKIVLSQWFKFIKVATLVMLLVDKRRSTKQILISLAMALGKQDIPLSSPIWFFGRFN
jgi:hypothetical protein